MLGAGSGNRFWEMFMLRRLARLVAAVGVAYAVPACALGLGEIDVRSKLNQR
ncbi:MAG: hypothetical protein JWR16_3292, partial [Nevskia sp.]|nr:hypothetical protein [Nevskia sp.]